MSDEFKGLNYTCIETSTSMPKTCLETRTSMTKLQGRTSRFIDAKNLPFKVAVGEQYSFRFTYGDDIIEFETCEVREIKNGVVEFELINKLINE